MQCQCSGCNQHRKTIQTQSVVYPSWLLVAPLLLTGTNTPPPLSCPSHASHLEVWEKSFENTIDGGGLGIHLHGGAAVGRLRLHDVIQRLYFDHLLQHFFFFFICCFFFFFCLLLLFSCRFALTGGWDAAGSVTSPSKTKRFGFILGFGFFCPFLFFWFGLIAGVFWVGKCTENGNHHQFSCPRNWRSSQRSRGRHPPKEQTNNNWPKRKKKKIESEIFSDPIPLDHFKSDPLQHKPTKYKNPKPKRKPKTHQTKIISKKINQLSENYQTNQITSTHFYCIY